MPFSISELLASLGPILVSRDDNSPDMENDIFQMTIDSWAKVTSWNLREAWYRVIRISPPISANGLISLRHFRYLSMGKIDVITYKYVIMSFFYTFIEVPVPRQESKQ